MKTVRYRLGLCSLVLLTFSCAGEPVATPIPEDWVTHEDDVTGFQVSTPSDWAVLEIDYELLSDFMESSGMSSGQPEKVPFEEAVIFRAGLLKEEGEVGSPNVAVVLIPFVLIAEDTPDRMLRQTLEGVEDVSEDYELSAQELASVGGHDAAIAHYSYLLPGISPIPDGEGRWWLFTLMVKGGSGAWAVSCGVFGQAADVQQPLEDCKTIVLSFRPPVAG